MAQSIINKVRKGQISTLFKGAGLVFALQMSGIILAYGMQYLLVRWMGTAQYGDFTYGFNWAQFLMVFAGLGFTISLLRFVPQYYTVEDGAHLRGVISFSSIVTMLTSLLLVVGIATLFLFLKPPTIVLAPFLVGLGLTPLLALRNVLVQVLRGLGSTFMAYAPGTVFFYIASIALCLGWLAWRGSLTSIDVLAITAGILIVTLIAQVWHIQHKLAPLSGRSIWEWQEWMAVSLPLLLVQGFNISIVRGDTILVGWFLGSTTVGLYFIVTKTASLCAFALTATNAVLAPQIAPLYQKGDIATLTRIVRSAVLLSLGVTLVLFVGLFVSADWLLGLFDPTYRVGRLALWMLLCGQLVNAALGPVGFLLHMTGHQRVSGRIVGVCALLSVILNLTLIPRWGLNGAAFSTMFTMILQNVWMYRAVQQHVGISTFPIGWLVRD